MPMPGLKPTKVDLFRAIGILALLALFAGVWASAPWLGLSDKIRDDIWGALLVLAIMQGILGLLWAVSKLSRADHKST